jgi:ArsR family transcriptional regulator
LEKLSGLLKAAGDEGRLRILAMLRGRRLCVCQIQAVLGLSQPAVSQHLAQLKRAGLITSERQGKWIFYRIAEPKAGIICEFLSFLVSALKKNANARRDGIALSQKKIRELASGCKAPAKTAHRKGANMKGR